MDLPFRSRRALVDHTPWTVWKASALGTRQDLRCLQAGPNVDWGYRFDASFALFTFWSLHSSWHRHCLHLTLWRTLCQILLLSSPQLLGLPEARAGKSVMCHDYFIRLVDVSACAQQGSALDPYSQAASSLSSLTSPLGCSPTLGCSRAPIRICLKFAWSKRNLKTSLS